MFLGNVLHNKDYVNVTISNSNFGSLEILEMVGSTCLMFSETSEISAFKSKTSSLRQPE